MVTFTDSAKAAVRSRRRRRWTETYARYLAILGIIAERLSAPGAIQAFPESWRPYIIGAAAALGVVTAASFAERRYDYKRWLESQSQHIDHLPNDRGQS